MAQSAARAQRLKEFRLKKTAAQKRTPRRK